MPDRWRLGSRNPFTVYRVADGAHDVEHAREHFVTSFRREEDARLAVDAVNAQGGADSDDSAALVVATIRAVFAEYGFADPSSPIVDFVRQSLRHLGAMTADDREENERIRSEDERAGGSWVPLAQVVSGSLARRDWPIARNVALALEIAGARMDATTPPSCDCPTTDGAEDNDPNLAHRAAVDITKLSGPETRSLLLCTREGRVGGKATIGDSRLHADIVWAILDNGGTPGDVHRSYPWCSVEDAAVLDRLRRDVQARDPDDELVARLSSALGVSLDPDDPDPVGRLEAAAGKAREVEVVTSKQAVALPPGSWVLRCHQSGTPWLNASPRPADAIGSAGDPRWLVLYRAPAPAPAALAVGEVVTGDRALAAPVGTKLGAQNAAVAAVHTTGGWSVTGMNYEQDHEHAVRINEWVVLVLPEGGET